ncbi:MAG: phosphopantetheine-binding protein [Desulfuromonadales bacterium]
METTEKRVMDIISKYCETPQKLSPEMILDELDIASINIMEIIISVEEEFGITVKDEDLMSLTSIQSVIDYVNKLSA